jgi:hypothetical protein
MIENSKNKRIDKDTQLPQAEVSKGENLNEYFYAGKGVYFPITIRAKTQEEADEIYTKKRININK